MNKSISYIILLIAFPFYFTGCKKEVRPDNGTPFFRTQLL